MKSQTIRQSLLRLSLLPMTLLLIVVVLLFSYQGEKLLYASLVERGTLAADYFASASEYGLITGNTEQLRSVSKKMLHADVVSLKIYDIERGLVLQLSTDADLEYPKSIVKKSGVCNSNDDYVVFCAPILSEALPTSDFSEIDESIRYVEIGSVELVMSTYLLTAEKVSLLLGALLVAAVVMVVSWLLSRYMDRALLKPIGDIRDVVERVSHSELDVAVDESGKGEMLDLQKGINSMITAISASHYRMDKEIKLATRQLEQALASLEQRNFELDVQRKSAEASSLAKSQFLATMSHEIRTPLSGMIGMLQIMRTDSMEQTQLENLDSLECAAQSLRQLIDDIMDFSRMEAGKLSISFQSFSLLEVLEGVIIMLSPSAQYKGLELVLGIETKIPNRVVGDPLRVRQVLINLVANAIKFTDQGEVIVLVRESLVKQSEKIGLRFEVIDSGIGIAEDKHELVFKSFTQIDEGDSRRYGGSGLGASVSQELVHMMGGEIGLESALGEGSRFWFELPFEIEKFVAEESPLYNLDAIVMVGRAAEEKVKAIRGMMEVLGMTVKVISGEQPMSATLADGVPDWVFVCDDLGQPDFNLSLEKLAEELPVETKICQIGYSKRAGVDESRIHFVHKPLVPSALHKLLQPKIYDATERCSGAGLQLSVLLAEDEDLNAKVIEHFLSQGGHRVVRVDDGESALQQLQQSNFDCVLMDMRMPVLDGLEATRRWRAIEGDRHLPIIALTANASDEDRKRCMDAGMTDYLTKPVDSNELLSVLERYCSEGACHCN